MSSLRKRSNFPLFTSRGSLTYIDGIFSVLTRSALKKKLISFHTPIENPPKHEALIQHCPLGSAKPLLSRFNCLLPLLLHPIRQRSHHSHLCTHYFASRNILDSSATIQCHIQGSFFTYPFATETVSSY